eukprot:337564_1
MESFELEHEIDPTEQEEERHMLGSRDLRQRSCLSSAMSQFGTIDRCNGRRAARRGLMMIPSLAAIVLCGTLVARLSCRQYGICAATSSSSSSSQIFNSR